MLVSHGSSLLSSYFLSSGHLSELVLAERLASYTFGKGTGCGVVPSSTSLPPTQLKNCSVLACEEDSMALVQKLCQEERCDSN